jgi:lysophospholipase L1-like esterase
MPADIAKATSDGVYWLFRHPAGGRIRFRTNSKNIAVKVYYNPMDPIPHMTNISQFAFDLFVSDNRQAKYRCSCRPALKKDRDGLMSFEFHNETDGEMHTYMINMALFSETREFYIGLDSDALIEKAEDYTVPKPVLFYGSSITQGLCATRPGNTYEAMLSRRFDFDYINLGFAGNAKGEPLMADYLASLDPSVFVLDYDHNADDAEHLKKTYEPLFQKFRAAHPTTPVIMISKPDFRMEDRDDLRREVIRGVYEKAVASGDRNVYFIDGETLHDGPYRDSCTVDGTHPNDLGFCRMAEVIGEVMAPIMEKLKA